MYDQNRNAVVFHSAVSIFFFRFCLCVQTEMSHFPWIHLHLDLVQYIHTSITIIPYICLNLAFNFAAVTWFRIYAYTYYAAYMREHTTTPHTFIRSHIHE